MSPVNRALHLMRTTITKNDNVALEYTNESVSTSNLMSQIVLVTTCTQSGREQMLVHMSASMFLRGS